MSRLIKSCYLAEESRKSIAIRVAPVFTSQQAENKTESTNYSIEDINKKIEEAKVKVESLLAEAAKEKEKVLQEIETERSNWENEKQQWIDKAYKEGKENGFQAGEKKARMEYESKMEEAKETVILAKVEHEKRVESSIETIVGISIKVAEKILGQKLEADPSAYRNLVQTALKEVKEKEEIKIFVNPSQYPLMIQHKQLLQNIINSHFELSIFPEAELADDGCWIDSSAGRMEVSVQSQLMVIKDKLLQLVRAESHL